MQKKTAFSTGRIFRLMRLDVITYRFEILICTAALILFLTAGFWLNATRFNNALVAGAMFHFCLLMGGSLLTSEIFADLYRQKNGLSYLALPATQAEKFISRYLLTSVGYFAALSLVFFLVLWPAGELFEKNAVNVKALFLNKFCFLYLILHALFIYGAVRFRSQVFVKTVLSVTVAYLLFYLIIRVTIHLLFWRFAYIYDWEIIRDGLLSNFTNPWNSWASLLVVSYYPPVFVILPLMFFPIPLVFWPLAFQRLRESED